MPDEIRRPRGRPRGASGKPYAKRVPRVEGFALPSAREEEFSPKERGQVQDFMIRYDTDKTSLTQRAQQGNYVAAQTLFNRFKLTFPPIESLSRMLNGNGNGRTSTTSFYCLNLGLV